MTYTVTTATSERQFDTLDARTRYLEDYLHIAYCDVLVGDTDALAGMAEVNGHTISWGATR